MRKTLVVALIAALALIAGLARADTLQVPSTPGDQLRADLVQLRTELDADIAKYDAATTTTTTDPPPTSTDPPTTSDPPPTTVPAPAVDVGPQLAATPPAGVQVPASIDATCATDATAALMAFIRSVPDGSTIVFPRGACYEVENILWVDGRNNLTFEGEGAQFVEKTDGTQVPKPTYTTIGILRWPRQRAVWFFNKGSNITVRNFIVRGVAQADENGGYVADLEAQHALEFTGTHGVLVERSELSNVYGDGVNLAQGVTDAEIRNNSVHNIGRQGMAVTGAARFRIHDNLLDHIARSVLDIEPNGGSVIQSGKYDHNTVGAGRNAFVAMQGAGSKFDDVEISDNHALRMDLWIAGQGSTSYRRTNIRVLRNVSDVVKPPNRPTASVFEFARTDGLVVQGNVQQFQGTATAVQVINCTGFDVSGNSFLGVTSEFVAS